MKSYLKKSINMKPGIYKGLYGGFIVIKKGSNNNLVREYHDHLPRDIAESFGNSSIPYNNHAWTIPNKWLFLTRQDIQTCGELMNDAVFVKGVLVHYAQSFPLEYSKMNYRTPVECGLKKETI